MTPAVVGDTVFVGSCSGRFYALGRESGEVQWVYDTNQDGPPGNFHGEALVTEDLVVVGSDVARRTGLEQGHIYAFEQATGEVRWAFAAVGGVASEILRIGDRVFGVTLDGELVCLDLSDGTVLWRIPPSTESRERSLRYSVLRVGDRLVFSSPGGRITSVVAETGKSLWERKLDHEVNTSLVLLGESLFVGTHGHWIYRLNAATGEVETLSPTEGIPYGSPVVVDGSLLFLIGGQSLVRFDADLDKIRWSVSTAGEWSSFRPQLHGEEVLVGNDQGEVVFADLSTGQVNRKLPVTGTVRGFTLSNGLLHVGTLNGLLMTYRP